MRIMGLDYGSKTVGVAISDPLGFTAQGIETIDRKEENKLRKTLARIEELAKEYEGKIVIYKVDIDKCQQLAQEFGVSSIPAILYIPLEGKPSMTVGSRDKARFKEEIDKIILN